MELKKPEKRRKVESLAIFAESDDDGGSCNGCVGSDPLETTRRELQQAQDRGNTLASEGNFSSALTSFDTALRLIAVLQPVSKIREAALHELRAQVLLEMGNRDFDAVSAATRATEVAPGWSDGFLTLGRCQLNLGEPSFAIKSMSAALRLNPNLNQDEEVVEDLERAMALHRATQESGVDIRAAVRGASNMIDGNASLSTHAPPDTAHSAPRRLQRRDESAES
mmetsp:Transcript_36966/g.73234  ORF Transcript_36966/g.73234 Transcript_36966/m.73234 type:complete len:224 (+) Transcript_36966:75-746(+)